MLGRDADPVVAYPDLNDVAEIAGRHFQDRAEGSIALPLALSRRVEAVADQVEKDTGHVLRHNFGQWQTAVELPFHRNVEVLILSASAVKGEVQRLFNKSIQIDTAPLATGPARVLQHALDDPIGPLPMLGNLFEVAGQHFDGSVNFSAGIVV